MIRVKNFRRQISNRFAAIILTFTIGISASFAVNYYFPIQDNQPPDIFEVEIYRAPVYDGANHCTLTVKLDKNHKLFINKEEFVDAGSLGTSLSSLFAERTRNGAFRNGTYEIEKTVIVRVDESTSYEDLTELIGLLKGAGANPIQLCADDCQSRVTSAKANTEKIIKRRKYLGVVRTKLVE